MAALSRLPVPTRLQAVLSCVDYQGNVRGVRYLVSTYANDSPVFSQLSAKGQSGHFHGHGQTYLATTWQIGGRRQEPRKIDEL